MKNDITKEELLRVGETWGARTKKAWSKEKIRDAVRERIRECYLRTKEGMTVYCNWGKTTPKAELQNIPLMQLIYDIEKPGTHPDWELPKWYEKLAK